jgi:hypothetical protein
LYGFFYKIKLFLKVCLYVCVRFVMQAKIKCKGKLLRYIKEARFAGIINVPPISLTELNMCMVRIHLCCKRAKGRDKNERYCTTPILLPRKNASFISLLISLLRRICSSSLVQCVILINLSRYFHVVIYTLYFFSTFALDIFSSQLLRL